MDSQLRSGKNLPRGVARRIVRRLRIWGNPQSLVRAAVRSGKPAHREERDLLLAIEETVEGSRARRMALMVDEGSASIARLISVRWPALTIICLTPSQAVADLVGEEISRHALAVTGENLSARHRMLAAYGQYDVIIDAVDRTSSDRLAVLRDTFFHLRRGGTYLTTESRSPEGGGHPHLGDLLARAGGAAETCDQDRQLIRAIRDIRRSRSVTSFVNAVAASPKLRYHELDDVLARRPTVGRLMSSRPAVSYASKAVVSMNRDDPPFLLAGEIKAPSLGIREYDDVLCAPYQVLVSGGILLTDSYRHYLNRTLTSRYVDDLTDRFALRPKPDGPVAELSGSYFYLGSEFPQHFGHVMTEQLSRLWAWSFVKEAHPAAKALVDVRAGGDGLKPWEIAIFAAAGVAEEDLVGVEGAVTVETLIAATPMLVNTQYAHPDIVKLWSRTGDNLVAAAPHRNYPEKIFVSRRDVRKKRRCRNTAQIEQFFAEHGFRIVYPEDHSVSEQVMLFRRAKCIAGLAGSGLFTLCFCEPKQVIMIWPDTYTSRNEYLICSAIGHHLTVFWCAPDAGHPPEGWDTAAYQSSYAFDFDRDGGRLAGVLRSG